VREAHSSLLYSVESILRASCLGPDLEGHRPHTSRALSTFRVVTVANPRWAYFAMPSFRLPFLVFDNCTRSQRFFFGAKKFSHTLFSCGQRGFDMYTLAAVHVLLYCDSASDAVYHLVNNCPSNEAIHCTSSRGYAGQMRNVRAVALRSMSHAVSSPWQSRHLRLPLHVSVYDESTRVQYRFFGIANFIHSLSSFLSNAV